MGRFFQTAPTQFIDNYIYQPPWELMQQAASQKQKIYDAAIASTKLFDNIPIEHLQGEDDVYNVQEKQRYYAENAANIAKAIQNDPSKAQQYLNNIDSLQKELQKDMTSGDLSKIIGSAQAYKKWQEDNKKRKEDDPSRYSAAERAYLGEYLNAGGNSLSQGFRGEQVTKGIDYDAIRKSLGELKANKIKSTRQTPGGGLYMVETENGLEEMSEERMNGWMLSQILSPENLASLSQSEKFGLGTYRNSEGNIDYDNGSLFAPLRGFARAGHYSQQENSFKMSADSAAIAQMNEAGTNNRFYTELNYKKQKDAQDRIDAEKKAEGDRKANKELTQQTAIAEAMAEGDYKKAAELSKLFEQDRGGTGSATSNVGSRYSSLQEAASKAKDDPMAKKQIERILPSALKEIGINFKDPKQKALAKEITDKVILGKLKLEDVGDYIEKRIPISRAPIDKYDIDRAKSIGNIKYKEAINPMNNQIEDLKERIENEKSIIKNYDEYKSSIQKMNPGKSLANDKQFQKEIKDREILKNRSLEKIKNYQKEIENVNKKISTINKNKFFEEAKTEISKYKKDLNTDYRGNIKNKFEEAVKNANSIFDSKKDFSTHYEISPSDAIASSRILSAFDDPNFKKEFTVEVIGKDGKSSWKDMDELGNTKFSSYEGVNSVGPNGLPMWVLQDSNGKKYNVIANTDTPQSRWLMNTAVTGMTNKKSQIAYQQLTIPEAGRIENTMQALKLKGINEGKFPMKFKDINGEDHDYILQYDISGKVNLINPMSSTEPLFSTPVSTIEAGKFLNTILYK